MNFSGDFYIDLGTTNTLIYAKGKGIIMNEPTVLTVLKREENIFDNLAYGEKARRMIGKTPMTMHSLKPLKQGVISDFESALTFVNHFFKTLKNKSFLNRSRIIISLPYKVAEHEKEAIRNLGKNLGANNVDLISEPMIAAIGSGLDILESRSKMIVDIGGGTSEAAILSLGGIVLAKAKRVGGSSLDEAIVKHLKDRYHFSIGEQSAERLKVLIGSSIKKDSHIKKCKIGGIDLSSGLPLKIDISSDMIFQPVDSFIREIVTIITEAFEECPPEVSGDLVDQGIILTGGGALLGQLSDRITQEVGVKCVLAKNPLFSVAAGGAKVLENHSFFDRLQVS